MELRSLLGWGRPMAHIFGLARNYRKQSGPGTFWIIFGSKSTQHRQKNAKLACHFFQDVHFSGKKRNCATPEAHGLLAWLALACLAYLASDRPRSPCLHQQQQQRRSAPPGRRRRPGCCCLGAGKASEADPRRGKPSMPRPAKQAEPAMCQKSGPSKTWFWA
mgnify:FL=1